MRTSLLPALLLLLPTAASTRAQGEDEIVHDDAKTERALRYLIAAGATPAATGAYCIDPNGPDRQRTIGDDLARRLAWFGMGTNVVSGDCRGGRCRVRLTHQGGEEDLFSWEYRFRIANGRVVPGTIGCFGT